MPGFERRRAKGGALALCGAGLLAIPFVIWLGTLAPGLPFSARLHDAGRLAALLGLVRLAIQYVLSARIPVLERGLGLDRLLRAHRFSGLSVIGLLVAHPALILVAERLSGHNTPLGPAKALGLVAILVLGLTVGAAFLGGSPRVRYETWIRLHRVGFTLFPVALVHGMWLGSDLRRPLLAGLWAGLAGLFCVLLVHRWWRAARLRRHPFKVRAVIPEAARIWTVVMARETPLAFAPGQFAFVRAHQGRRFSPGHPFTISSGPQEGRIRITVKGVGDFSSGVGSWRPGTRLVVDGPYGTFTLPQRPGDPLVFLAGGIGITPFLSMLRDLYTRRDPRPVTLIWVNRNKESLFGRGELETMVKELEGVKVVLALSRGEADWPGERGRLDRNMLLRHVPHPSEALFYLCGPPQMMKAMLRLLKGLGVGKGRIAWERFSLR